MINFKDDNGDRRNLNIVLTKVVPSDGNPPYKFVPIEPVDPVTP